jgi:hypothetical protein
MANAKAEPWRNGTDTDSEFGRDFSATNEFRHSHSWPPASGNMEDPHRAHGKPRELGTSCSGEQSKQWQPDSRLTFPSVNTGPPNTAFNSSGVNGSRLGSSVLSRFLRVVPDRLNKSEGDPQIKDRGLICRWVLSMKACDRPTESREAGGPEAA